MYTEKYNTIKESVLNGKNVARINFSHGKKEEHLNKINIVKKVREELEIPVAILVDTRGPEIRTNDFESGSAFLEQGTEFTFKYDEVLGNSRECSLTYKNLYKDIKLGDKILIDDGLVELEVKKIKHKDIVCIINNSGYVSNKKGVNVPGIPLEIEFLSNKDKDDILWAMDQDIDFIAASFVRNKSDITSIRLLLKQFRKSEISIIAKIENQQGIDNIEEIMEVADGIMIARGDLGVEIKTEKIPQIQKWIIKLCNEKKIPVITSTQMLDSMMRNPRPTRAEIMDVANAVYDGTDCLMLSGETAAGKYPVQSLKTMTEIAKSTEEALDYDKLLSDSIKNLKHTTTDAISYSTCTCANSVNAKLIITATFSGYTARMISKFKPKQPIIATTTDKNVLRRLQILWGVTPFLMKEVDNTDELINTSIEIAQQKELISKGDYAVITAGVPINVKGTTNFLKIHEVK